MVLISSSSWSKKAYYYSPGRTFSVKRRYLSKIAHNFIDNAATILRFADALLS